VIRREDENCMKRIMTAEVIEYCSWQRPKKRWGDVIQQDLKSLRVKREDTGDRNNWRRRLGLLVADLYTERD